MRMRVLTTGAGRAIVAARAEVELLNSILAQTSPAAPKLNCVTLATIGRAFRTRDKARTPRRRKQKT
jgi:hypothetical protein